MSNQYDTDEVQGILVIDFIFSLGVGFGVRHFYGFDLGIAAGCITFVVGVFAFTKLAKLV